MSSNPNHDFCRRIRSLEQQVAALSDRATQSEARASAAERRLTSVESTLNDALLEISEMSDASATHDARLFTIIDQILSDQSAAAASVSNNFLRFARRCGPIRDGRSCKDVRAEANLPTHEPLRRDSADATSVTAPRESLFNSLRQTSSATASYEHRSTVDAAPINTNIGPMATPAVRDKYANVAGALPTVPENSPLPSPSPARARFSAYKDRLDSLADTPYTPGSTGRSAFGDGKMFDFHDKDA